LAGVITKDETMVQVYNDLVAALKAERITMSYTRTILIFQDCHLPIHGYVGGASENTSNKLSTDNSEVSSVIPTAERLCDKRQFTTMERARDSASTCWSESFSFSMAFLKVLTDYRLAIFGKDLGMSQPLAVAGWPKTATDSHIINNLHLFSPRSRLPLSLDIVGCSAHALSRKEDDGVGEVPVIMVRCCLFLSELI
jgi:hypothetical protein